MGLDTTYEAWHGAYSAFFRWRRKLAFVAGYSYFHPVHSGLDGECRNGRFVDWDLLNTPLIAQGNWLTKPDDPLLILLAHSDCDGHIRYEDCIPLADRLEELMPYLHGSGGEHIGNYRAKTQQFIDGLRAAADDGQGVLFR